MIVARIIEGRDFAVVSCESNMTVRDAVSLLAEKRIGALPVLDGGKVAGIFSERDVIYQLSASGPDILEKPVCDVMTSPALTVTPETSVLAALSLMSKRRIRHLPVLEGETMIGFISIGDLVKFRIDMIESEAEAMRSYIQTA